MGHGNDRGIDRSVGWDLGWGVDRLGVHHVAGGAWPAASLGRSPGWPVCFDGSQPPDRASGVAASTIEIDDLSTGDLLLCARCEHPITTTAARVEIAGAHVHRRENTHGYFFTFGCFGAAPGAVGTTPPTREDSWFSGFAWSIAQCTSCRVHLGWRFDADRQPFFGLILDRLREVD